MPVGLVQAFNKCIVCEERKIRRVARPRGSGRGATKGARGMPWRQEPMKDVVGCDKPRGAASRRRSGDVRMRQRAGGHASAPTTECIGSRREPGELKHLSTPRKRNQPRFPK